jgi:hypothetical protein
VSRIFRACRICLRIAASVSHLPRAAGSAISIRMQLEGRAMIDGHEVSRRAVPAEDMMQACAYHHLVPAEEWIVAVVGGGRFKGGPRLLGSPSVKLPAGGTAEVRLALPTLELPVLPGWTPSRGRKAMSYQESNFLSVLHAALPQAHG